jgi:hypothetical protein
VDLKTGPDQEIGERVCPVALEVFDVPQRQQETDAEHHRQADDFWRGFEIPERGSLGHPARLGARSARLNQFSSDTALIALTHRSENNRLHGAFNGSISKARHQGSDNVVGGRVQPARIARFDFAAKR